VQSQHHFFLNLAHVSKTSLVNFQTFERAKTNKKQQQQQQQQQM